MPPKILPFEKSEPPFLTMEKIERSVIWILVAIVGFFLSYTFNHFDSNLTKVQQDISAIQVGLSALAQHVQDEDVQRLSKKGITTSIND